MKNQFSTLAVRLNPANGQRQLHALTSFPEGEVISEFGARETLDLPSYLTVQVGTHTHILLAPEDLQYCNHSCAPNVFFDTTAMQVVALRHIMSGEELTFFYPSTEWMMAQPFQCFCGNQNCLGLIEGAAFISKTILNKYRLTDFVLQQLQLRERQIA